MSRPTFVDSIERKTVVLADARVGRLWHCSDNGTVAQVEVGGDLIKVPKDDVEVVE